MKRLSRFCFTRRAAPKTKSKHSHLQNSSFGGNMENPSKINDSNGFHSESLKENPKSSGSSSLVNIENTKSSKSSSLVNLIHNHDFSGGLHSWHPNSCEAFVVSSDSSQCGCCFTVITNRKESWQGLEQDITSRIAIGSTYTVHACVGVSGSPHGSADVQATVKLEYENSETCYLFIARKSISKERWEKLEGTFSLSTMPDRVIFYLEGPSPGVDIRIQSVVVSCSSSTESDCQRKGSTSADDENNIVNPQFEDGLNNWSGRGCKVNFPQMELTNEHANKSAEMTASIDFFCQSLKENPKSSGSSSLVNIENTKSSEGSSLVNLIHNHDFSGGLHSWHPNNCEAFVVSSDSSQCGCRFAVITNRKESWQGLEQDITSRVAIGSTYTVHACVGVSGSPHGSADVQATVKLEYENSETSYLFIARKSISKERWEKLEGTFSLSTMPDRVIFYLEGPTPGVDLHIQSVVVSCSGPTESDCQRKGSASADDENIIVNPQFEDGLNNWSGRGCKVILHDSMADGKITPKSGKFFASATERTQSWNGIQQDITGKVKRKLAYEVTAVVRIYGNNVTSANVQSTLWVQAADLREQYIGISNVQATDKDWVLLQGKFLLNGSPSKVVVYLEGPPPGTDILLNSLIIKHAAKIPPSPLPIIENPAFGVNIIANGNLSTGTNGWFPLGNCNLSVANGSPHIVPPMARESLGAHEPLSGRYIHVTNRTQTWMGPAQLITDKIKLYLTYQVSAWVRLGPGATSTQNVNVALGVDDQWVNGGQVEVTDDRWHEIGGSFRIEKQPAKVMVYVQGPASGIDLMVAGLQIFPVDRKARFKHLKRQIDKVRKRDVILKFSGSDSGSCIGTVKVKQTQNSFPFGSCLSRTNMDNEDFVDFFVKNFNWAVFGNELKWYWTEPQQGNFNYKDADEMVNFCTSNNIQARGHCIFWEVENTVQQWIRNLNKNELSTAVQNRLTALLTRYKGKFEHYDVNNEMLHGSFYQDRLGKDTRANMFKIAHQLDPSPILFVNDYHIEDGCDTRSSPEKYIQQILDLQEQGAPVGGIGIQGHIDCPVGPVVCSALDKLGILGLPIWLTELDVSCNNEFIRAEDVEVMLREAYAHPAVDGIMLWGFWELFMSRDNSHLVNAEGDLNAAGKKYLDVKEEWLSHAHGPVDDQGQFCFRGFQGSYQLDIVTLSGKTRKTFVVDKGDEPLELTINL